MKYRFAQILALDVSAEMALGSLVLKYSRAMSRPWPSMVRPPPLERRSGALGPAAVPVARNPWSLTTIMALGLIVKTGRWVGNGMGRGRASSGQVGELSEGFRRERRYHSGQGKTGIKETEGRWLDSRTYLN